MPLGEGAPGALDHGARVDEHAVEVGEHGQRRGAETAQSRAGLCAGAPREQREHHGGYDDEPECGPQSDRARDEADRRRA